MFLLIHNRAHSNLSMPRFSPFIFYRQLKEFGSGERIGILGLLQNVHLRFSYVKFGRCDIILFIHATSLHKKWKKLLQFRQCDGTLHMWVRNLSHNILYMIIFIHATRLHIHLNLTSYFLDWVLSHIHIQNIIIKNNIFNLYI